MYRIFKFLCNQTCQLQKEREMLFGGSELIGAVPKSNINLISYNINFCMVFNNCKI